MNYLKTNQETKNKLMHITNLIAEEFDIKEVISLSKSKDINSKEYADNHENVIVLDGSHNEGFEQAIDFIINN